MRTTTVPVTRHYQGDAPPDIGTISTGPSFTTPLSFQMVTVRGCRMILVWCKQWTHIGEKLIPGLRQSSKCINFYPHEILWLCSLWIKIYFSYQIYCVFYFLCIAIKTSYNNTEWSCFFFQNKELPSKDKFTSYTPEQVSVRGMILESQGQSGRGLRYWYLILKARLLCKACQCSD